MSKFRKKRRFFIAPNHEEIEVPISIEKFSVEALEDLTLKQILAAYSLGNKHAIQAVILKQSYYRKYYAKLCFQESPFFLNCIDIDGIYCRSIEKAVKNYSWISSFPTFLLQVMRSEIMHEIHHLLHRCSSFIQMSLDEPIDDNSDEGVCPVDLLADDSQFSSPVSMAESANLIDETVAFISKRDSYGPDVVELLCKGCSNVAEISKRLGITRYRVKTIIKQIKDFLWNHSEFGVAQRYNYD